VTLTGCCGVTMRRLLVGLVVLAGAASSAGATNGAPLPSAEAPNSPGSIVVPFAISTPPSVGEQRSSAQLLALWQRAGAAYGIPWEVLGAVNKIESDFGRNMGPSSAGAVGWMQFLPSTWARWGVDANGDGVADPWNPEDAVYAAARYLAAAGGRDDLARGLFAYNHVRWYVDDVLELASVFAGGGGFDPTLGQAAPMPTAGPELVFKVDRIEERLDRARKAVNMAKRKAVASERRIAKLDADVRAAEQRAGDAGVSDAEFQLVEAELTRLVVARERALLALDRRRARLADAIAHLDALRDEAAVQHSAVILSRPLATGLGTPQFSGEYVFPVGGGPEVVSVTARHHDYPAADVVAPEGSPVYALTNAVVADAWPSPHGRCGIGFRIRAEDGGTYVYCHLSFLEATVVPGAALTAGAPVGLVGSTGNSTGPHLHLQYVPAEAYPQEQAWFQSFAGVAFRWQRLRSAPAGQLDASD
jgi:murein DD-endopeptidase MepM/ murein hydrolase activator NlpD